MSEQRGHTEKKKRRKWPWIVLLCFFGLIGLVRLALMTAPVHRLAKNIIVNAANKQLKPQLSIGGLSGDLWNDITLTDVTLSEDRPVAGIDTLHVTYHPLSYFSSTFQIGEINVVHPFLRLRQGKDSTWNVQHWVAGTDTAATDTTGSAFTFNIAELSISKGKLEVTLPQLQQDSSFVVDNMNLESSLGYYGDSYEASVDHFNLDINNTRLDAPISLSLNGSGSDKSVTLGELAIATGYSKFNASGKASFSDSTADFKASASPLGWKDIAAYAKDLPIKKNVDLSLRLSGNTEAFSVSLKAESEGIEQLSLHSTFSVDSSLTLSSLRVSAKRLALDTFLGDTGMPALQDLDFKAQGHVSPEHYQQADINGTLSAKNISQGSYRLDALRGTFSLHNAVAAVHLKPVKDEEKVIAEADLSEIWSEEPSVSISIKGSEINPARWLQDEDSKGNLSFRGEVSGAGWYPENKFWTYNLSIYNSTLMDQSLESATFSGRFNGQTVTNQSTINVEQSKLMIGAEAKHIREIQQFSFNLDARKIDLSDFPGLHDYPTSISGTVTGRGTGNALSNLEMQSSITIDSSTVNGERIDTVTADLQIADSLVKIRNGLLKSDFADADMSARIHAGHLYDTDNAVNLNVQLKDISSFAALANADILQAKGTIEGKLKPAGHDSLVFDGRLNLNHINYDDQFTADEINGGVRVDLDRQPRYVVDFDISKPAVSSVNMQNIGLKTQGKITDHRTNGSFEFELKGADEGRIFQAGNYRIADDSISAVLNKFDLSSSLRTLSLEKPFHAQLVKNALKTDTLRLSSKDDASFVELSVPYADTLTQQAYLKGKKLNMAVIQNAILEDAIFEGMVSTEVHIDRTDTSLTASGDVVMSNLQYHKTRLDTLQLQADIKNERLKGMMKLYQDSVLIAEGNADIPFKAKKPGQLDEDFFDKPVKGELKLHAVELSRFSKLLDQAGYKNTEGILRFNGKLDGKAGEPEFKSALSLKQAKLSGVSVDSLIASANYQNEQSKLNINAGLTSLQQKVVELDGQMPLHIDWKKLEISLPGQQDSISVDVKTDNFNLKVLNDFINRDMARNLKGRIDGNAKISGPRNNLQASGKISLKQGAVRVVPAGIRLDHIQSTVQLEPDQLVLSNLHMESGKGRLDGEGTLGLEKLVPGDIDISVKAKNFKAANTDEYNAVINLGLDVGGSVTKPDVSGKLKIINGFIELDNFGEKSVEQINLDSTESIKPKISLYDSLNLDMDIVFNKRFYVRNERYLKMEIELDGQIDLLKKPTEDLQIFGTLNTPDGYAEPLGKRFDLEKGTLAFSGPPANPQLSIRTLYEPPQTDQEIKIWYIIEGTVENPQFKYESSPPMDLAGIISYTLFGQPYYKLNPSEQSVASSSSNNTAADLAMDVLLDRVESLATKELGIDVVRIENTRVGSKSGTSITTGWYISPKVFFAIQNVITGSTPSTGFYLEYYLKKNLKLILGQGNDNRQGAGVGVQWKHDY